MPKRMIRTSPAAAITKTTPTIKDTAPAVRNGTPPGSTPGVLINLTPPARQRTASPTATVSATALIRRVHDDAGRTVVRAVPTKYAVTTPTTTLPLSPPLRRLRIDAL